MSLFPPVGRDTGADEPRLEPLDRAEEPFHALQTVMAAGFMTLKSVRDSAGKMVDFEWLHVNPAECMVERDRADLLGKHLLAEMPGNRETGLFDVYVRVLESGEAWRGESYDRELRELNKSLERRVAERTALKTRAAVNFNDLITVFDAYWRTVELPPEVQLC